MVDDFLSIEIIVIFDNDDKEIREDSCMELREDGSIELRE